ncbi:MAG: heavy metal-associated domain-containing protein [Chitinophagaceae bacterium]
MHQNPEITIRKNEKGLIVSRFITTTNSVEYTYTKINSSAPESENAVTTILTNINCEEGKRIIERLLKSQDGVKSAAVDIKTGKLKLDYNSDGTPYKQIISLINDAGFDADRVKSTNAENNPCAAKPSGNNITTIQTNINCEEGKRIIERILKSQDGVKSAIVDIKTGKLKLDYSSDGTPLTQIIFLINDAGFDADRVKSKNVVNNPCKTSLPKDVNSLSKDVYVAGFESNGAKNVAKVWKNGVATSLTNGTYDAAAHSVYVSGTDVYVSGNESNGTKEVAKVWKNGVATSLTNGTNDANASSVYVSGTDVYVAGYESNGTKFVAKVWKNGVATSLTNGANDASANSVYVSGTDIYVAGDESDGTTYVAKLWKNGVATSLTDGTNSAHPDGVYVSGTDVYVVGNERFEQLTGVAKVWKNGVATSLTNGSNHAFAKSVYVSGTDVYVAGMELKGANLVAKVWKNGVATTLTNGSSNGFTYSVYVSGKDVYVAGAESNGTKDVVKVWKNGVATSLTNGSNDGRAYSIFVTGSEKAITNPPTSKITTVQTNINCEEGKRAIEKLLKSQDGVKSASVDIKTGKLKLDYSSDGTPLTQIISLINEAGFDADRVKSTNAQNNPCIKKQNADKVDGTGKVPVIITPPPTLLKPVIFTTNINCAEGEEKVLPLIKKLTGVLDASVNTKTGWLGVTYNQNNKTLYDAIINVINDAGFDADNKKTIYPDKNPCIRIITHKDNKKPIEVGDNPYVVTPPKEIPKEVSQSKISTIKGKLFYRYKKEGEQPVSNALNLPGGSSSDKISYPDFVAAQRFPKTTDKGTQPLKNAKVSLVYTTLSPKQMNPSRYEDFPILGLNHGQMIPCTKIIFGQQMIL